MSRADEIISDLIAITEIVRNGFGTLSVEQLNWKPDSKSWSAGQCLEHLIVTNELYFPNIQKVIDGTHRNNFFSRIPFAVDLIGRLMRNSLDPEQPRKMKTFKIFEPQLSSVPDTIVGDFAANQQKLIAFVEAAGQLDLDGIRIAEPLSAALNLRLGDAFEILAMHERRHLKQAARVLEMHRSMIEDQRSKTVR